MSADNPNLDMIDLFREELVKCTDILTSGTAEFAREKKPETLRELVRAAHSIKGAARIVGLGEVAELAQAMEQALTSVQQDTAALSPEILALLDRCTAAFTELSQIEAPEIASYLERKKTVLGKLTEELAGGISPPASVKKQKTPAEDSIPGEDKNQKTAHENLPDISMLELFKVETENHTRVLEKGLVDYEHIGSTDKITQLMRAAHSIKGAARIIGLNLEVSLAHAMEDVLSAVQEGMIELTPESVDILLRSNDIFKNVASLDVHDMLDWLVGHSNEIKSLIQELTGILAITTEEVRSGRFRHELTEGRAKTEEGEKEELIVRVMADSMNRIMGLAGECLVQAKSSRLHSASLLSMKNELSALSSYLEKFTRSDALSDIDRDESSRDTFRELFDSFERINDRLLECIGNYEQQSRQLEYTAEQMYEEVISSRMRPFSEGLFGFPRYVRDLARKLDKKAALEVNGSSTLVDKDILEKLKAPLNHLLRNAVDHGIEPPDMRTALKKPAEGKIVLEASHIFGMLYIMIRDDGRGIDRVALRKKIVDKGLASKDMAENLSDTELYEFMFLPGFSTAEKITELSGRGVGLDVVFSMVQEVGGSIQVESGEGTGTAFHLKFPLTLSVTRALLVSIGNEHYALPLTRIDRILKVPRDEIKLAEGRQYCMYDNETIGIVSARQVLRLPVDRKSKQKSDLPIIIISDRLNRYGFLVDAVLDERELVVQTLDPRLGRIPTISSGSILEDGSIVLIMDIDDLVRAIDDIITEGQIFRVESADSEKRKERKRILVVDDSLTVRQVERKQLEINGYEVTTAVDGIDGWNTLKSGKFDLIVTDVDMPRLNGIDFVKRIKADTLLRELPVMIISYKDREEDRMLGLKAGANYYLTKGNFHDESFINAVKDLIGEA